MNDSFQNLWKNRGWSIIPLPQPKKKQTKKNPKKCRKKIKEIKGKKGWTDLPVDGDEDHTEDRGGDVAVEEEGKEPAEGVAEDPGLMDVARRRQRQVEGAEDEIGGGQRQHEGRRRVLAQLAAAQQRHHRQQIACPPHPRQSSRPDGSPSLSLSLFLFHQTSRRTAPGRASFCCFFFFLFFFCLFFSKKKYSLLLKITPSSPSSYLSDTSTPLSLAVARSSDTKKNEEFRLG